jgi:hypothetical protein
MEARGREMSVDHYSGPPVIYESQLLATQLNSVGD